MAQMKQGAPVQQPINLQQKIQDISDSVATKSLMDMPLSSWRPILAADCQVFVFNESYLAKRFDQINYKFCNKDTAKEILIDNLYALLRFKYFPKANDDSDVRIRDIINSFTSNLKTSLLRVSFNKDETECKTITWLPNGCVAFRNGVYDFANNNWLFKYDVIQMLILHNKMFAYDPKYIITWYINIDFEPYPIDIRELELSEFMEMVKELDTTDRNLCFELMYNMAHDSEDRFDMGRFTHLCEILGYLCYQSFCQKFVLLIGAGRNGKNSLFDGCFTDRIIPKPAAADMFSLETDRFITGALENKAHNIYLETSTDETVYRDSTKLKALTGSPDQTIENKGENKYSGIINCKHIWSANDQERVRFHDTTEGFKRRINVFEIFFHWDERRTFMKRGDYYDTTFSEDLSEIKGDINNLVMFVYFAMFGIKAATRNFTRSFNFTENDWRLQYTDIDFTLKDLVEHTTTQEIYNFLHLNRDLGKTMFLDEYNHKPLYEIVEFSNHGSANNYNEYLQFWNDTEDIEWFFANNQAYVSLPCLQQLLRLTDDKYSEFSIKLKKAFNISKTISVDRKQYVKMTIINGRIKLVND